MPDVYCSRCGFLVPPNERLKSRHTGDTYCLNIDECSRRARNDLTFEEISELGKKVTRAMS